MNPDDDKPSPLFVALGLEDRFPRRRKSDRILRLVSDSILWAFVIAGIAAFIIGNGLGLFYLMRRLFGF